MLARPKRLLVGAMIALAAMPFAAAFGQDFPPGPVDDPPTVSSAIIFFKVDPLFRPLMVEPSGFSYPGYRETSATLESPWLTDPATTIGRSAPHVDGDAADLGGAPVGSRGTIVSDSDIVFPAGFEGPAGTREVHTEIASLHLQDDDGLIAVRGGAMAPNRPRSLGEVESQGTGTDFPADSFFSVFAAIDLPPHPIRQVPGFENVGFPGATIHNPLRDPLIVQHPGITEFPPRAEYNHSGLAFQQPQPRVDLLFSSEMPGLWNEGQRFGQLILATHGMSFDANNPIDLFELNIILANLEQAPPDDPGTVGDVQITGDAGDWDLVDQSFIPAGDPQSHLQLPTLNADERSNSLDPYDMQLTVTREPVESGSEDTILAIDKQTLNDANLHWTDFRMTLGTTDGNGVFVESGSADGLFFNFDPDDPSAPDNPLETTGAFANPPIPGATSGEVDELQWSQSDLAGVPPGGSAIFRLGINVPDSLFRGPNGLDTGLATFTIRQAAIPEPTSMALLVLIMARRPSRRRRT